MILDEIRDSTRKRIKRNKDLVTGEQMKHRALTLPRGEKRLEPALRKAELSFICEVKKASPSKGLIAEEFPYLDIAKEYEEAGADAISVLTEPDYFKGADRYLSEIAGEVKLPVLRKDFILEEYQIYEAKVLGASAVLLICALLEPEELYHSLALCEELGLSALTEVHDAEEVNTALKAGAGIIGVNNRNLKTFEVDFENCLKIRDLVPPDIIFVAESGIQTAEDVQRLRNVQVDAVLVGESLMRSTNKTARLTELKYRTPLYGQEE